MIESGHEVDIASSLYLLPYEAEEWTVMRLDEARKNFKSLECLPI